MRVLFEGGPHDGGVLDVDNPPPEYVKTYAPSPRIAYDPNFPTTVPAVRVYTYKRWRIAHPGDEWRIELRYCLDDGRKPIGLP